MTASMSFYADDTTTVRLNQHGSKRTPILALDSVGHSLTVSAFDRFPLADHLAFARALATACADYVKALEAIHAAEPTDAGDRKPDREH
ncbi:hypothetical protein GCM10023084_63980 [Streptomyces lacrimifluminis]|uniref:Uncharacterized protein n=1 Tax=Streptomyces lacrimifluminis TaxID=1500077 RepID=A0A917LD65_9ACTN|nr:hypothetical protein [Streptomyces lacrimifluminis]GGJ57573.1 hypothetical protein GCM10012282_63630 [Streptomyces lacrimifluminis]